MDLISEESGKSLKKLRPHYHFETKSLPDHKRKSHQELRFHSKPIRSEENSELNRELGICPRRKNVVILSQGRGGGLRSLEEFSTVILKSCTGSNLYFMSAMF